MNKLDYLGDFRLRPSNPDLQELPLESLVMMVDKNLHPELYGSYFGHKPNIQLGAAVQRLIFQADHNPTILYLLAEYERQNNFWNRAFELLDQAISADPRHVRSHLGMLKICIAQLQKPEIDSEKEEHYFLAGTRAVKNLCNDLWHFDIKEEQVIALMCMAQFYRHCVNDDATSIKLLRDAVDLYRDGHQDNPYWLCDVVYDIGEFYFDVQGQNRSTERSLNKLYMDALTILSQNCREYNAKTKQLCSIKGVEGLKGRVPPEMVSNMTLDWGVMPFETARIYSFDEYRRKKHQP